QRPARPGEEGPLWCIGGRHDVPLVSFGLQHGKDGALELVGRGPHGVTRRSRQRYAPRPPGDHAHGASPRFTDFAYSAQRARHLWCGQQARSQIGPRPAVRAKNPASLVWASGPHQVMKYPVIRTSRTAPTEPSIFGVGSRPTPEMEKIL